MFKYIESAYQSIEAMAIINPKLSNNRTIQIEVEQRDEGSIPHVHVYHDKSRNPNKCSYIRLDRAEYSTHHKDNIPLPKNLKDEFIEIMETPFRKYSSGYEQAVETWADTYESGSFDKFPTDADGNLIIPDYAQL